MKLDALRLFCDVVETKNFTRAAERNGITQSAVSQMLQALEKEFGARLVDRRRHVFQLTPAGEICHQHSREIVRLAGELAQRMQQARDTSTGVIELATCYSIGLHQLPPVLRQFRRDFPKVEVRVRYGLVDWVHGAVMDDAVDLGLACYPRRLHGLNIDPFRHERLVLVCHPRHPQAPNGD